MSNCCTVSSAQVQSACPKCGAVGQVVDPVTPRSSLVVAKKGEIADDGRYFFCATPDCDVAYYQPDGGAVFSISDVRLPITVKDDGPDTRLCYCFKITKGEVLQEVADMGFTMVLTRIHDKMAEKGCFCEKSNPSGRCCIETIKWWMGQVG